MTEESTSLKSCFADAERQRLQLANAISTNDTTYQENLLATIAKYIECAHMTSQASIFSRNETLEDVSTGDLQSVA